MKRSFFTTIFCLFYWVSFGQIIESKIVIEDDRFNYVTVDNNYQIGTLCAGDRELPLNMGKSFALPAGRNNPMHANPFSWDIQNGEMVALSVLDHPLNDRNEAIKKFELSSLKEWSSAVTIGDMVNESIEANMFTINQPYLFWKSRTKYFNHFYFDGVFFDNAYWMVSTNNGELVVWKYADEEWVSSEMIKYPVSNYVDLIVMNGALYMIDDKSVFYTVSLDGLERSEYEIETYLNKYILIEDRDKGKLYYILHAEIDFKKTIDELLISAAVLVD